MNQKRKSWLRAGIILILLGWTFYFMREELDSIWKEIQTTPYLTLIGISFLGLVSNLVEGSNYYLLLKPHDDQELKWLDSIVLAIKSAFYRLISFGFGGGVATIYYLNIKGKVPVEKGTAIVGLQYISYKLGITLLGLVGFLMNRSSIKVLFEGRMVYLYLALLVNVVIILGIILLIGWEKIQKVFISLLLKVPNAWFKEKAREIGVRLQSLSQAFKKSMGAKKELGMVLGLSMIRLLCLYTIPFLCLRRETLATWPLTFSLMAVVQAIAGVIPSPSGVGSLEFVFFSVFSWYTNRVHAGSAALLYRYSFFFFPALVGGILRLTEGRKEREMMKKVM